jgi:hypothetical protein
MKDFLSKTMYIQNGKIVSCFPFYTVQKSCNIKGEYLIDADAIKDMYKLKLEYYDFSENGDHLMMNNVVIGQSSDCGAAFNITGKEYIVDCSPLKYLIKFLPDKFNSLSRLGICTENDVSFVTTDGIQLAISKLVFGNDINVTLDICRPVLKLNPKIIVVDEASERVKFVRNDYEIITKYCSTGFPDYKRVIQSCENCSYEHMFSESEIADLIKIERLNVIKNKQNTSYLSKIVLDFGEINVSVDTNYLEKILSIHKKGLMHFQTNERILIYNGECVVYTALIKEH